MHLLSLCPFSLKQMFLSCVQSNSNFKVLNLVCIWISDFQIGLVIGIFPCPVLDPPSSPYSFFPLWYTDCPSRPHTTAGVSPKGEEVEEPCGNIATPSWLFKYKHKQGFGIYISAVTWLGYN